MTVGVLTETPPISKSLYAAVLNTWIIQADKSGKGLAGLCASPSLRAYLFNNL